MLTALMPIYVNVTDQCQPQPPCAGLSEYIRGCRLNPSALARNVARQYDASSRRLRRGLVWSMCQSLFQTDLNMTRIPAPSQMPNVGECSSTGHSH